MMFLLVMDVPNYGVFISFANKKDAISGLPMEMVHLGILLLHGPLGLVFLFRSVTQGYTLGWDTDQPFGLSESVTSAVAESLFNAQRQYFGSIQTYKLFINTGLACVRKHAKA